MEFVTLNNGLVLPQVGLGTYTIKDSRQIVSALEEGYRLFDSAIKYGNEKEIGNAILSSGYKDTCVISKISGEHYVGRKRYLYLNRKSVKRCLQNSNKAMFKQGPSIYLLHYLFDNYVAAYKELISLYEEGKIKAIGVCNCESIEKLQRIKDLCGQFPMINEVEIHPYYSQQELITFCKDNQIQLIARSPLAHGDILDDLQPKLCSLTQKYNKSVVQIILKWIIQQGIIAIPRTKNVEHLKQNLDLFDFSLSEKEMQYINNLNMNKSFGCFTTR